MDDVKKPNELVEKLLNEDPGDEKLDPVYLQRRDAARAAAGADDDEEVDDGDDPDNEIDFNSEADFASRLGELIEESLGARVSSFKDEGVLTNNEGLVVRLQGGSVFQVTIVEARSRY